MNIYSMFIPNCRYFISMQWHNFFFSESTMKLLSNDEYILDVCTELEHQKKDYFLLLKRTVWIHPLRLDNNLYIDVMFFQVIQFLYHPDKKVHYLSRNIFTHRTVLIRLVWFQKKKNENAFFEGCARLYRRPSNCSEAGIIERCVFGEQVVRFLNCREYWNFYTKICIIILKNKWNLWIAFGSFILIEFNKSSKHWQNIIVNSEDV